MTISVNGEYFVGVKDVDAVSALHVSGSLGAASLTFGYKEAGIFTAYKDEAGAALTGVPGNKYELRHGKGREVYAVLTGATELGPASIDVTVNSIS